MARVARIVLPGLAHHVTHRGNRRADIFYSPDDRAMYLDLLAKYSSKFDLAFLGYCLMTNHIHLVAVPGNKDSLAKAVGLTHMMYSRWINSQRGWTGHLWANRFYSAPIEPKALNTVLRYVELNPVRAEIVERPEAYRWSSARAHCLSGDDPLLDPKNHPTGDGASWRRYLGAGIDGQERDEIRSRTGTGTPIGSQEFVERLEERVGRPLLRRRYRRREEE